MTLHFLGTYHDDPLGPERLRRALEIEHPDFIAVEGGEAWETYLLHEGNKHRRQKLERARKRGLTEEAYRFAVWLTNNITLYESRIFREYAREKGIPFRFVENDRSIEEDKKLIQEDLTPQGIKICNQTTKASLEEQARQYYDQFNALFQGKIPRGKQLEWIRAEANQDSYKARDRLMAEEMKRILAEEGKKVVFVGGILHALEDRLGNSLWTRLRKYSPTRATIGDEKYGVV